MVDPVLGSVSGASVGRERVWRRRTERSGDEQDSGISGKGIEHQAEGGEQDDTGQDDELREFAEGARTQRG